MDILELLSSLSPKRETGETWLVAGLGNPDKKYVGTRHNVGFDAADALCEAYRGTFKAAHKGLEADVTVNGKRVIVLKPLTYMNLSGESVGAAAHYYKVPPERVIVFCDDINLAPGILRIRESGSAGGHNGLKNIILHLNSEGFARVRIGVGMKPHPDADLADHVLGKPTGDDRKAIDGAITRAVRAIPLITDGKAMEAQSLLCREK